MGIGYLIFFRKPVLGELLCSLLAGNAAASFWGGLLAQAVGYGV